MKSEGKTGMRWNAHSERPAFQSYAISLLRRLRTVFGLVAALAAVACFWTGPAQAATRTWDNGNASFLWGDEVNWDGASPGNGIPGAGDTATFGATGVGTVDLGGVTRAISTLTVNVTGYTIANGSLTLGVINSGADGENDQLTISASVSDGGNKLVLNSISFKTITGQITITEPTLSGSGSALQLRYTGTGRNGGATLGSTTLANTVAGGVYVDWAGLNGPGNFNGTWTIGGDFIYASSTSIGTINLNNTVSITGNLRNGSKGGTIRIPSGSSVSVGGHLSIELLQITNYYTPNIRIDQALVSLGGDVRVYNGVLNLNVTDPVSSTSKVFLLGNTSATDKSATISINTSARTLNNPISVQSGAAAEAIIASGAAGTGIGNKVTYAGNITLNKALSINAYNGANCILDVRGAIGGAQNVTVNSGSQAGTVQLSATNTYSGNTLIYAGTLQVANNLALQNSALDTSGAGILAFSTGINTPTFGGLTAAGNLRLAANVTSLTLNLGTGVTNTYSGALSSATGRMALTKTGTGTQILSGANTYAKPTVINAGTLKLGAAGSINNSSSISIAAGAIFDVSAIAPTYTLSTNLTAGGTGTAFGISAAAIHGPSGGTNDLGSRPILLTFTPTDFTGDTNHPPLLISQGALALNNNPITVSNATATRLGSGSYRLIQVTDGSINVYSNPTVNISEDMVLDYAKVSIAVDGGNVNLLVEEDPRQPLKWATGNGDWDINTATNWINGNSVADVYMEGDAVILEDNQSVGSAIAVTLNTAVNPQRVIATNSIKEYTISGTGGISGEVGLTKSGTNSLTLSTANAYAGNTVINGGTLALGAGGSIDNTPQISIAAGATFDVSAIADYALSISNTLRASGMGATGVAAATIRGGNTVDLGSRPISLTFTPSDFTGDAVHPALVVSQGALTLSNNSITVVNAAATPLGVGIYRLIQIDSGSVNGAPLAAVTVAGAGLAPGASAYLAVDSGTVNLVVQASNDQPLAWATGSGTWDIATTANWKDRTNGVVKYFEGDQVVLEDTQSGASPIAVTLKTAVNPASVTVNTTKDYALSGSGGISGAAGLIKSGSGSLTLSDTNTFYGGVTLNAGTLNINSALALGTDNALTLNGGTLNINSAQVFGLDVLTINGSATIGSSSGPKAVETAVDWLAGTPLNISENLAFGTAAFYLGAGDHNLNIAAGKALAIGGIVSGAGNLRVDCASSSGTLILTGANTFSSPMDVRNGILSVSSVNSNGVAGPLGKASTPVTLGYAYNPANATMRYTGSGETTDRGIKLDNNSNNAVLTLDHSGTGLLKFTTAFTFRQSQTRTLVLQGFTGGTGELAGALGENGTTALIKDGTGTWTLSGANTYRGSTTISNGTLKLGASGSISNSQTIVIAAGAVFSVTNKASYTMSGTQTNVFGINPAGVGSAGRIDAGALDISSANVVLNTQGRLDDSVYILATYTPPLTGAQFANVTGVPDGYAIDYGYQGNQIGLIRIPASGAILTVQ